MIAVDTNVMVRFLIADDIPQHERAVKLVTGHDSIFISKTVMLELEWVLRSAFKYDRKEVAHALSLVISMDNVEVESVDVLMEAIRLSEGKNVDFADVVHALSALHCQSFYTFDRKFVKSADLLGGIAIAEVPH